MTLRVLIDAAKTANLHSGLGQFCRSLGMALTRLDPPPAGLGFVVPPGRQGMFGAGVAYRSDTVWRRLAGPGACDIWHATHQDSPFRWPAGARTILTIHDLNFLEREDYSPATQARRLARLQRRVDRASAVVTISEYTAEVVRAHLGVSPHRLSVIHNGNPLELAAVTPAAPAEIDGVSPGAQRTFVYVGAILPKKNLHVLIPAIARLPDTRFLIAGPDRHPYADELRRLIGEHHLGDRVRLIGPVDDAGKAWLYDHADGLLFPSLAEGFGLPVVEAMSRGTPVFLSRLTSLPEVGGEEANYFESFDPDHMAALIADGTRRHRADPERAARLRTRAALFSWDRAARRYRDLYLSVAGA